ncbi:nicotinate (nicotinamide) nucleotide adenylyltransferase, partial [bacterium]|nr:nicotinate (nicotinamide) nucleotide adenylyltransferase [bacterium]
SAWKNPRELARQLFFLVFPRSAPPRPRRGFRMKEISLRIDISATEIRERIRKKLSIEGLVLPSVERAIWRRELYR